jgi:sirohydrochlorin cobaltochelatase
MNAEGLLLIAHGSKDPGWKLPFESIKEITQSEFKGTTALAYLESTYPSVEQGVSHLLAAGATKIKVAPLFLALGAHVRSDIPRLIEEEKRKAPGVSFSVLPAIGLLASVQQLISTEVIALSSEQAIPGLQKFSDDVSVAAQICVQHIDHALQSGYQTVICNRPDEEEGPTQTPHSEIAQACAVKGLRFIYYPVSPVEQTEQQVRAMAELIIASPKPVLVYCRSGRRSKRLLELGRELAELYSPESFG